MVYGVVFYGKICPPMSYWMARKKTRFRLWNSLLSLSSRMLSCRVMAVGDYIGYMTTDSVSSVSPRTYFHSCTWQLQSPGVIILSPVLAGSYPPWCQTVQIGQSLSQFVPSPWPRGCFHGPTHTPSLSQTDLITTVSWNSSQKMWGDLSCHRDSDCTFRSGNWLRYYNNQTLNHLLLLWRLISRLYTFFILIPTVFFFLRAVTEKATISYISAPKPTYWYQCASVPSFEE